MKILWINTHANFVGGAETYIYQTARSLSKLFDVEHYLFYSVQSRVDTQFISPFTFSTVIASLQIQIERVKPDIIYVHRVDNDSLFDLPGNLDIPIVAFIHDHTNFCLREHKYTTFKHQTCTRPVGLRCYACLGFLNKKPSFPYLTIRSLSSIKKIQNIYKKFTHIVVGSEYMKEHLTAHHFKPSNISKIVLFSEPPKDISTPAHAPNGKHFLFVGQLIRGKGVDTLLDAFALLNHKDISLDICGDGKQRAQLEEQAKTLGIQERVFFHGKVTQEELAAYYSNAYAVVIPSRAPETFNLVGLEAMKYKKAVIASDVGGIKEWLKEDVTGLLFPSNDSHTLSLKLQQSIHDEVKTLQMGEAGFESYNQHFHSTEHAKKLYSLFKTLSTKEFHAV